MATLVSQNLQQGVLTLTISIPAEELAPYAERASTELQRGQPIPGFRPGKATLASARQAYGEMRLLERALSLAIPTAFASVVKQERFMTIGPPEVEVTRLVPAQPIEFTARVAVLPPVTLGRYKTIKETRQPVNVTDEEVDEVIENLLTLRAKPIRSDTAATAHDRVIVDLMMSRGGVPVEGGQTRGHAIDLFKPYTIPGFLEALTGLTANDRKEFSLPFPKDHYDRHLAGQDVDFTVTVRGVYTFDRPALDDRFAASLGRFATVDDLKTQIRQNLMGMREAEEEARVERAIVERLIAESTCGEIPEILMASELWQMLAKQKSATELEGGIWTDYLAHLKKTPEELAKDWAPEAAKRIQAALLVRAVAEAEGIVVAPHEVTAEQTATLAHYPDDPETQAKIKSDEYAENLRHALLTKKVMEFLKRMATQK